MALPTVFQLALLGFLPTFLAWDPNCINKPVGFGRKTTGGEGGRVVTPKNEAELLQLLKSSEKLIIDLDKAYDYTSSLGQKTEKGCWYSRCGQTAQKALPMVGACVGRPATSVSYHVAGLQINALVVGSQKTIKSSNGKGEIRGRGLLLCNAHNVIIRDITVCDINPDVVWGGDAISLKNTQDVWIHRVTIKNIGRQHLVAHISPNRGVTVSSCLFDGTTKYSSYCDGEHYWIWLFRGPHDEITLINNKILNSAGRIPHAGGLSSSKPYVHIVGNFFDTNGHIGIEPWKGAIILAEANYFYKVRDVVNLKATGGNLALINSPAGAQRCASHFGTTCKVNSYRYSLNRAERIDENALTSLAAVGKEAVNEARAAVCLKGEELSAAAGDENATSKEKPENAKKSSAPIQKQKQTKARSGKLAESHKSGYVKQKKQTKTKNKKLAGNNESKHGKQKKQTQKKNNKQAQGKSPKRSKPKQKSERSFSKANKNKKHHNG